MCHKKSTKSTAKARNKVVEPLLRQDLFPSGSEGDLNELHILKKKPVEDAVDPPILVTHATKFGFLSSTNASSTTGSIITSSTAGSDSQSTTFSLITSTSSIKFHYTISQQHKSFNE